MNEVESNIIEAHKNNVYANTIEGVPIHISVAKSGRKGYFCLGCKREMQAVKYRPPHASFFRHDPKDVTRVKCTYSDLSHRLQLAKDFLVRTKKIKVPVLYKYPPANEVGEPYKIADSEIVTAHHVYTERYFYENREGDIYWGDKKAGDNWEFLFKSDVLFLNQNDEPILLIQLAEKNKNDELKKIRLKRLNYNAVQVSIPKESPEDIFNTFERTERTKWIFNHEQERTEYVRVSSINPGEVSAIDELQRDLFEENFTCRQAEIRNLIRSIIKCLESKSYRDIKSRIEDEIERIDAAARAARRQLGEIQTRIDREAYQSLRERREGNRLQTNRLGNKNIQIERVRTALEKRNSKQKRDLEREESETGKRIGDQLRSTGLRGPAFTERKREIEREARKAEGAIESANQTISELERTRDQLPEKYKRIEDVIRREFETLELAEKESIERIKQEERELPEIDRRTHENIVKQFEVDKNKLADEFDELQRDHARRIKERITEGNSELSGRIKDIIHYWAILRDFESTIVAYKRNRKAWSSFNEGTWKNWRGYDSILKSND